MRGHDFLLLILIFLLFGLGLLCIDHSNLVLGILRSMVGR